MSGERSEGRVLRNPKPGVLEAGPGGHFPERVLLPQFIMPDGDRLRIEHEVFRF